MSKILSIIWYGLLLMEIITCSNGSYLDIADKNLQDDKPAYQDDRPAYTVSFDSKGGSTVNPQTIHEGDKVTEPTSTRTYFVVEGWYKEATYTTKWVFASDTVKENMTLYAKWQDAYSLRDTGPAGGLIFYVNANYETDGWRFMEAAPNDQNTGSAFGCDGTDITGAVGTAIGTGYQNTLDLELGCTTTGTAADLCAQYSRSTYDDWFLPSVEELYLAYQNLHNQAIPLGGFTATDYYTSSEIDKNLVYNVDFSTGNKHNGDKYDLDRVRAIRKF